MIKSETKEMIKYLFKKPITDMSLENMELVIRELGTKGYFIENGLWTQWSDAIEENEILKSRVNAFEFSHQSLHTEVERLNAIIDAIVTKQTEGKSFAAFVKEIIIENIS